MARFAVSLGALVLLLATGGTPLRAVERPSLRDRVDRWLTESDYRGVVLIAKDGEVVLRKGYGLSDREAGTPNGPGTVFTIGSITKPFTAAAILKLESQGKLSVEDSIAKHLPNVPEDKKGVTIHHLLTHTSGLASDFAGDFDKVGRDEYVRLALASTLQSPPGSRYDYANSGYSLLGAIVERASGRPYEAYLREELLLPAGMKETGYRLPQWEEGREAVGYRNGERWGRLREKPWAEDGPYWALRANGGILSTVDDLYRWQEALEGTGVLSEAAKQKIFTPHVAEDPNGGSHYGYGWAITTSPWGTQEIGHNGGNTIFSADLRRFPDDRLVVITMSNEASVKAWRAAGALARIAHGEEVPVENQAPAGPLKALGTDGRHAIVRAWFDAYRSGEPGAMDAFRAKYARPSSGGGPSPEQRAAMLARVREDLGGLEPVGVIAEEPGAVLVRVKTEKGIPARFRFAFDPEGKFDGVGIEVGD
jgi:CubicO group peptidase (beta-lactamase class C family)